MSTFDAKAFWRKKKEEEKNNAKKSEHKNSVSSNKTANNGFNAKDFWRKSEAQANIGLDTLESDLTTLSKTIGNVYNGWQTQETMKNTLSSVQSMYDRLEKYQEYQKKYGGADLSELQSSYKSVIDGWDNISKHYGTYKSAKEYNEAVKTSQEKAKEYESMKTADLESVRGEITNLEGILKTAKEYENNVQTLKNKTSTWEHRSNGLKTDGGYGDKIKVAEAELNDYLESIGYENVASLEKALGEKKQYKNKAEWIQKGIKMSSVGNEKSENYDKEFAEKSKYVPEKKSFISFGYDTAEEIYDFINADDKKKNQMIANVESNADSHLLTAGYEYMTDQEIKTYNYYFNEHGEDKAMEYLNTIKEGLSTKKANERFKGFEGKIGKELLFGIEAGFDQFASGISNLINTSDEYIPINSTQQLSGLIRDDIKYEHGTLGQVGYDLINTTSNMLPSILTAATLGAVNPVVGANVGAGLMGASAAGNAYQEMLNLGYDKGQARTYSTLIGLSEATLQRVMGGIGKLGGVSGKLSKMVSGIDNGLAKFAVRYGGSILSEGFEEAAQEVLNPIIMNFSAGYDTGEDIDWSEVVYSGLLGALSGGLLEGGSIATNTYAETSFNKSIGQNIKTNEQVQNIFDIASASPETSLAYEAYTQYAKKGINADNIKDAQLGSLWQNARMDAENVAHDKKTSTSDVLMAKEDYAKLGDMAKYNPEASAKNRIAKETYKDTENVEALIESGLESGENTESYKLATELKAKLDNGKKITNEEINSLIKANDNAIKDENTIAIEERASAMEKEDANLFKRLYDGKTDVDEYANAYELMKTYANNPNSFDMDYALENKGVLSTEQATEIYKATSIQVATMQKTTNELYAQARKGERGIINDSIFNYGEGYVAGKVNWGNLNDDRKQAVVFAKGLYKKLGSNVSFTGRDIRFNGMYDIGKDMTFIDVYAGMNLATLTGKDFIIPTVSHELTHEMEVKSPELFKAMSDIVLNALSEKTGLSKNDMIADEIARLDKKHPDIKHTEADAISEIVARACEDLLSESKEARKMLKSLSESEQKTLIEKIKEIIQKVVDWIDEFLESQRFKSNSKEAIALREMKETFTAMSMLWDKMLLDVQKYNQALEKSATKESATNEDATSEGGMKYSLRKEAIAEIEQAISNKNYDREIKLTDSSPAILVSQKGVRNLPMMMVASHIRENILTEAEAKSLGLTVNIHKHYHGLGKTLFLNVIDSLDNVTEAYRGTKNAEKSERRENYFLLISKRKDSNGNTINVPVYVNQYGRYNRIFVETNKVATVFGRDKFKAYIQNEIAKGNLVRIKNRSTQASESTSLIDGDYSKDASKVVEDIKSPSTTTDNSIHNSNRNVNTKFSNRDSVGRQLTEGQQEYFKDSIYNKKEEPTQGMPQVQYERDINANSSKNSILNSNEKVNTKFSNRDYSYDELIAKSDVEVITLKSVTPLEESKYKSDYDLFAKDMRNIASKKGNPKNTEQKTYLHCKDLGEDILITRQSFKHGAARIDNAYISVCKNVADILNESIVVNELTEREKTNGAYVLLGIAENNDNYVVVRSIVNKKTWNLEEYEELYAIKKKSIQKRDVGFKAPALHLKSGYGTSPTISIANFLDFVNSQPLGSSVLSLDVAKNLNSQRAFDENVTPHLLYSERDNTTVYDLMGERDRLLRENEQFKTDVERLNERLKLERKLTHGNRFNENQLRAVAGHLRNIAHSNMDKVELMKSLKDTYSFIAHSDHLTWEDVFVRCYNIADTMLKDARPEKTTDDYLKHILRNIRSTKISLSEAQKSEVRNIFGKNWNRHFFNRVIITDSGIPIESKWKEWSGQYPNIFDADTNSNDMISKLLDIIRSLQKASETISEYNTEEQTRWLAREIYNQYWNVSPIRTTADKYDKQIKRLNYEHRNAMSELRKQRDEKLKKQHKEDREKYIKLASEIRERKDNEIAEAKQHGKERLAAFKENAERKTRIQSITANALSLNDMLVKNSKDKHIPEIMKEPVAALLNAIDFSSKRLLEKGEPTQKDISLSKALSKVKDMMVKATNAHDELVELYGHGLDEDIEKMVDSVDNIMRSVGDNEYVLNRMTLSDLQILDKTVKTIKHAVNKLNKFHTVNHTKGIANLSRESVLYLDSLGKGKFYKGKKGAIKKLLDWGNALPYYVFKRFGSGGMKVYEALQDGWDKFAFNTKKIIDFANETYTNKEVKNWSNEVKTFKILLPTREIDTEIGDYVPQYQEVQLTVPQIMSIYCLNKREQARGHLFQGGIRVADFEDGKGNIVSQSDGIVFTETDVRNILDSLTERQKAVADKLQEFMNTVCSDWGNEVSMERFGYKAFGEENYFPIQSDKNNLAVNDETEQPNSLFKLLNMSFTKSITEKANNRIVISDIFDVFAQHTSDMAKYNALALPVLDSFKWYNYTEKENLAESTFKTIGVKQSIEKAFGKDGQNYFTTFLKDINGQQEVSRDTLGKGFFSNAKIAAVGANLRVILLQPTSYARASAVIDNKYLLKALGHKPKIKKAEEHCGIALWKSMGYYDTNVQKGVEAQIKHNDTWKDKAIDWSMKGAEIADKVTWGYLWNACELEIREQRKDLKVGSKEFYAEISKRLREIIYATQVVDSTMTRSQMMRSGDGWDKMLTSFASEPTLAYNMLQDAYMELNLDARRMGKKEAWKKNSKRITRIVWAYTMTNALAALVESGFDAFREDDDEEMDLIAFMTLYLKNFAFDMSIGNKIPVIKELYSVLQGYSSSRMDTQWAQYLYGAINSKKPSRAIKNILRTASQIYGLPFYNPYRDTMATLNNLDLFTEEELNEMFEEFFD